jgi:hypothetical protein
MSEMTLPLRLTHQDTLPDFGAVPHAHTQSRSAASASLRNSHSLLCLDGYIVCSSPRRMPKHVTRRFLAGSHGQCHRVLSHPTLSSGPLLRRASPPICHLVIFLSGCHRIPRLRRVRPCPPITTSTALIFPSSFLLPLRGTTDLVV